MAIALDDAITSLALNNKGAGTYTISGKTTAGTNRVGLVLFGGSSFNLTNNISGVTWGGVAMTQALVFKSAATGASCVDAWYVADPPTEASDIAITVAHSVVFGTIVASFTGVDQATPISATTQTASDSSAAPSISLTGTAGGLVVGVLGTHNGLPTVTAGDEIAIVTGVSNDDDAAASSAASGETISWSLDLAGEWAVLAIELQAASGGGGTTPLFRPGPLGTRRGSRQVIWL